MYENAIDILEEAGDIPKMTRVVAEGIGYAQAHDGIERTLDRILHRELTQDSTASRIPKGFYYVGFRVLSPLEMFQWQQEKNKGSRNNNRGRPRGIDVARSDYHMVEFKFNLPVTPHGEVPVRRIPMFVPFLRRGSLMSVRGTEYHAAAVYHTPGICLMDDGLFVNFNFTRKVTFKDNNKMTSLIIQGKPNVFKMPATDDFYKGSLPDGGRKYRPTPIPLWLFARYGFCDAIKRYTGVDVTILTEDDARLLDTEHYVIIRSGQEKTKVHIAYVLAIPKTDLPSTNTGFAWSKEETHLLTLCASFFDVAHFFASNRSANVGYMLKSESVVPYEDIEELKHPDTWKIILGKCVLGIDGDGAELLKRIRHHLNEITRYICPRFRGELQVKDDTVSDDMDIYDFLYYATVQLNVRRNRKVDDIASLYGKRLTVVDYLLLGKDGFTSAVSHLRWKLEGLVKDLSDEEAQSIDFTGKITGFLNKFMSVGLLQGLESTHGEVSTFSCSTESMVLGISTHAIDQTETSKRSSRASVNLDDKKFHVNPSFMEIGSITYLPKSTPFGYGLTGAYVKLSPKYVTMRKKHLRHILDPAGVDLAKIGG